MAWTNNYGSSLCGSHRLGCVGSSEKIKGGSRGPVCEDDGIISGWKGTIWDWSVNAWLIFKSETLKTQR
jgi:hypothetical protein